VEALMWPFKKQVWKLVKVEHCTFNVSRDAIESMCYYYGAPQPSSKIDMYPENVFFYLYESSTGKRKVECKSDCVVGEPYTHKYYLQYIYPWLQGINYE
jgi:hypothetical protein